MIGDISFAALYGGLLFFIAQLCVTFPSNDPADVLNSAVHVLLMLSVCSILVVIHLVYLSTRRLNTLRNLSDYRHRRCNKPFLNPDPFGLIMPIGIAIIMFLAFLLFFEGFYYNVAFLANILTHITIYASYVIFLYFIAICLLISHVLVFALKDFLTSRILRSLDYIYFVFVILSELRIISLYRKDVGILPDLLSYIFAAAAIAVRVSRTTAEVWDWVDFRQHRLPIFAFRSKFRRFVRLFRRTPARRYRFLVRY